MPRELSEQDVEEFRGRLCAVAERQFAELGFEAVTLRSITAELGCSRMTPYRYFTDKADIFAAVRTAAYGRFAAAQEKALLEGSDAATRLAALGRAYVSFALREPDAYRLMFELGQPDPTGHPELREAEERAWAPLHAGVRDAVDSGVLEGDVLVLAHGFWAGMHGTVSLHLAGKLAFGTTVDQLVEPMLRQLFRGAAAP